MILGAWRASSAGREWGSRQEAAAEAAGARDGRGAAGTRPSPWQPQRPAGGRGGWGMVYVVLYRDQIQHCIDLLITIIHIICSSKQKITVRISPQGIWHMAMFGVKCVVIEINGRDMDLTMSNHLYKGLK